MRASQRRTIPGLIFRGSLIRVRVVVSTGFLWRRRSWWACSMGNEQLGNRPAGTLFTGLWQVPIRAHSLALVKTMASRKRAGAALLDSIDWVRSAADFTSLPTVSGLSRRRLSCSPLTLKLAN